MKKNILSAIALFVFTWLTCQNVSSQDIMSAGGTITVSHENEDNANENSSKLVDNDFTNKYLIFGFGDKKPIWFKWSATTASVAGIYSLTSGNDAPNRDPKNWKLEASNNDTDWTLLDERTDEVFSQRLMTRTFSMPDNATAYRFYRLTVTENSGDGLFQLSEWRLLSPATPEPPTDLVAIAPSGTEIALTWKDASSAETGFTIEVSTDGTEFTVVGEVESNATGYTHSGLSIATKYYYRVSAKNDFGSSNFSNVAEATTLDFEEPLVDLTNNGGVLSVQEENNNANENSSKIIDNDANTKYLLGKGNLWIQYNSTDKGILTKYTITSANDAPERDPKDWVLEGSNNGSDWTTLDTRSNQEFANRAQMNTYIISNTIPFNIYKITITTKGGEVFQAAEWELWARKIEVPAGPGNLTVKPLSETEIMITWKDNSDNESGFELERSSDGTSFAVHATLAENSEQFIDSNLTAGEPYYYRISATSIVGNSVYSNVAATRTKGGVSGLPLPVASAILSPNNDGVNDTWVIKNLEHYAKNEVKIFDRVGRQVYSKIGYSNEWTGVASGVPLPEGTYIYVVKFWPGIPDLTGVLTIIKDR